MRTMMLVAALMFAACSTQESPPTPSTSTAPAGHPMHKDPAKAKQLIASGTATVLDVRSPAEFGEGHVGIATNIPVTELAQHLADVDKLVGGDKKKPIVVYCAAGKRAHQAQLQLEAAGYTNVVNGGGYDDLH